MALKNRLIIPGILFSGVLAFSAIVLYSCVTKLKNDPDYQARVNSAYAVDLSNSMQRYEDLLVLGQALTNETRLLQESALRSIWWYVYDSPGMAVMDISVLDETNGSWEIKDIEQTVDPTQFEVSLFIFETNDETGITNWTYEAQFIPQHINNLYILIR